MTEQEKHEPTAEGATMEVHLGAEGLQADNRWKRLGSLEGYSLDTLAAFFDA